MKDNISPEEKLLRLIKGSKKQDTVIEENPVDNLTNTLGVKSVLKTSKLPVLQRYSPILNLRKIIFAVFIFSSIYLIASFIYPFVGLKVINLPKMNEEKIAPQEAEPVQEVKPYEFYLEGIKSKQIFSSASRPEETARPASAASADLIKGINLVGIISGDRPQAIIEDKITQKTYYVAKGQFVGAFQVEDIQEGKVILNYRGERFELYL